MVHLADIRVGTSGYSYPDWRGSYYPAWIRSGEMLGFYGTEFNTVEINSSFYRIPTGRSLNAMGRKVPPGFKFTLKLHQSLTHAANLSSQTQRQLLPQSLGEFLEALKPLQAEQKFGCLLAQFPPGFNHQPQNRDYLEHLRDFLGDLPTAIEFRHRSWINPEVFQWLRTLGLGFCCVDQPALPGLLPAIAVVTAPIAYVRLHGRNAEKWWQHQHAYERYDYSYTGAELQEWLPRLQSLRQDAEEVYVFLNNCYKSQAIDAARQLKSLLGLEQPRQTSHQLELL